MMKYRKKTKKIIIVAICSFLSTSNMYARMFEGLIAKCYPQNILSLLCTKSSNQLSYRDSDISTIREKLIFSPEKVLSENITDEERFLSKCKSLESKDLSLKEFHTECAKILMRYQSKNPIFLLGECTRSSCSLSRLCNSDQRNNFEKKIISAHLERQSSPVDHVSLGSSSLFSEARIATTISSEVIVVAMHGIDLQYFLYMRCRQYAQLPHKIDIDDTTDPVRHMGLLLNHQKLNRYRKFKNLTPQQIILDCLTAEYRAKQFLKCSKSSLYLYENVDYYLDQNRTRSFPKIISAADIDDGMSRDLKATEAVIKLKESNRDNGTRCFVLEVGQDGEAAIVS